MQGRQRSHAVCASQFIHNHFLDKHSLQFLFLFPFFGHHKNALIKILQSPSWHAGISIFQTECQSWNCWAGLPIFIDSAGTASRRALSLTCPPLPCIPKAGCLEDNWHWCLYMHRLPLERYKVIKEWLSPLKGSAGLGLRKGHCFLLYAIHIFGAVLMFYHVHTLHIQNIKCSLKYL